MDTDADFLLWNGVRTSNVDKVMRALAMGADPNQKRQTDVPSQAGQAGDTPLHAAFKPAMTKKQAPNGRPLSEWEGVGAVVCALLAHGADATALDADGYSPLMLCAAHEKVKIDAKALKQFLQASRSVINLVSTTAKTTALHRASQKSQYSLVKKLLDLGGDPNLLDGQGATALWPVLSTLDEQYLYARPSVGKAWKTVDALIGGGCDINLPNASGRTPAMAYHRIPLNELASRGADVCLDANGTSVLSEVLEGMDRGKGSNLYWLPRLEYLANTPGVNWDITTTSGKRIADILATLDGRDGQIGQGILAGIQRLQLDEAAHPTELGRSKPRL